MGKIYVIILKNGEAWFDEWSHNINEARHDASAKWGNDVEKVITYETFIKSR